MPLLPFPRPLCRTTIIQEVHDNWKQILIEANALWQDDTNIRYKAFKGMMLPGRALPPEIIGRMYADYCTLLNRLHDAYVCNVQIQKQPYMKPIISIILKRLFELREELVHLIVNDYIYVDSALIQKKITPFDIQVVVPYHYGVDIRKDSIEELLIEMYDNARKRKLKALKLAEREKNKKKKPPKVREHEEEEAVEEEEESEEESPPTPPLPESFLKALLIQRHERYRQYYIESFIAKCKDAKKYTEKKPKAFPPIIGALAVCMIQRIYRRFMELKRKRVKDEKRDVILGILPDPFAKKPDLQKANIKFYENRYAQKKRLNEIYKKEFEKETARIFLFKKNAEIENITEEIKEWFKEWYKDYGFFPDYPLVGYGGTILVVRGDWITIDEKRLADEKYRKATAGKSKEQLKAEKKQALYDAMIKREQEAIKKQKEAIQIFKAKCNPTSDIGYTIQPSAADAKTILDTYRFSWSWYDTYSAKDAMQSAYGYMKTVLTEDVMAQMHKECRLIVDDVMRQDLKLLVKAQEEMFRLAGKPFPKRAKQKPPKAPPKPKIIEFDEKTLSILDGIFDLELITRPTRLLKEIRGDLKYGVYEQNIKDPDCTFPAPGYGDVKSRLVYSCAMGCGLDPNGKKNKAVLLVGPPRNGKSFMVDAIAGEINAVKIDISPESLNAKTKSPGKLLAKLFLAARVFQPTVIFFKNIERLYYKKVPPAEAKLKPRAIKSALQKLTKTITVDDKVIVIATCSNPWAAQPRLAKMFNEIIFVPPADYGTVVQIYREKLNKLRSVPLTFELQGLGRLLEGYGTGAIIQIYNNVITPDRIVKLTQQPLEPIEFIEGLINMDIERVTGPDLQAYMDWRIKNSPLKKEVEEYKIINRKRAEFYKKLAQAEEKKKKIK